MARFLRFFSSVKAKSVPLYEAPEFTQLATIKGDFITEATKALGIKYNQFVPFYLESRLTLTRKRFVVKMDLLPEEKQIEVTSLQLGQLDTFRIPIHNLIPVTSADYNINHAFGKVIEHPEFMDMDMVYLIKNEQEFLVFDKEGAWKEEGVNHPELSFEKNFKEHEWMDFKASSRFDISGGNVYPYY